MRIGLVAEFNPLHTGHKYLISEARKLILENGSGDLVCVMSEFYTQRGEVAVLNGYLRAKEAVLSGCDLVLALPYRASVSYSDDFAKKSIEILVKCGITHLIFGTEEDISSFEKFYEQEQKDENKLIIKNYLKLGYSYPHIMSKIFGIEKENPNFILAYSYFKALKQFAPYVKLISIKREGQGLNCYELENTKYLSATSIRNNIYSEDIESYISSNMLLELRNNKIVREEDIFPYLKYNILSLGKEGIANIYDVNEGLENRIYSQILVSSNYNELVSNIKTKRYSRKRVQRILLNIFTNSTKYEMNEKIDDVRILAVNKEKTHLIRDINSFKKIRLHQKLKQNNEHLFKHDIRVARQYSLLSGEQDIFKYNIILV